MEEVLIVLVQFLVELFLKVLIYLPFDLPFWGNARGDSRAGWTVLYAVLGSVLGCVSVWVAPRHFLPTSGLRLANLVIAPLVAGAEAWLIARWRRSHGARLNPRQHFWFAFAFVLAFAAIRLAYIT